MEEKDILNSEQSEAMPLEQEGNVSVAEEVIENTGAVEDTHAVEDTETVEDTQAVEDDEAEEDTQAVEDAAEAEKSEPEAASETPATDEQQPPERPPVTPASPKKPKTALFVILGAVVGCAIIALLVVYFTVIKPNGIYQDAVAALEAGHFQECEHLMNKIPNHDDVPALRVDLDIALAKSYIDSGDLDLAESLLVRLTGNEKAQSLRADIQYLKAVELVSKGDITEAQALLDKIPNHDDPQQLHEQICYVNATAAVEDGDYETAYALFSELGDYEDAAAQKDIVYYEALAFKSLFNIQPTLKNPASLRVTKVTFYSDKENDGELDAIYEITATNSYGGSLGGYVYDLNLYDDQDDSGMISMSAYADPDDYIELLEQLIVDAIKKQTVFKTTVDVARMNRLLEGNASFKIDLPFQSGAVVES